MPEISIIVPVYKVEVYLKDCIESLLVQTFRDIEIILVDDGSPDSCGNICDEYAKKDSRIRVVHQENAGLSCARNKGVDVARGRFLCFVDSDDMVTPQYCQRLYDLLKDTSYDFSVCGAYRFEDGRVPKMNQVEKSAYVLKNIEFFQAQLQRNTEFGVWNKLYRRELFEKNSFYA